MMDIMAVVQQQTK